MLTRRELMALAVAGSAQGPLRADTHGNATELWDYFDRTLTAYDTSRQRKLRQVRTMKDLAALRERVLQTLTRGFGEFPERTPLEAKQTGEIVRPDYVIEKIVFESRPGFFVTANLYRPKSTATRRPAVVQVCGHYLEGKAAPDYAKACAALAMKGFVALILDPLGQGERIVLRDATGKPTFKSATYEHIVAGGPAILLGITLSNYMIWDTMRAFDYLETRTDVDAGRFGLLGHSGGGMQTLLTVPVEPRIKAAMSCCAVTSFYHKTQALLNADPEQIVPGVYAAGVDHPELIAAVAPRAFLIGAVLRDFVPLAGTRRTFEEVKPIFEMAGVADNVAKVESDNVHMLDRNLREACYGWMTKHLMGESGDVREPDITVETEEALRATKTGNVMDLEGSRSVFDLNRQAGQRLARSRKGATPDALRARLGLVTLAPDTGIQVPSTLSPSRRTDVLLILAAEQGRNATDTRELIDQFNAGGFSVLAVDLRGWGETKPNPPGKKGQVPWDEFFAWRSFEMGAPLLGMRVSDLLAQAHHPAVGGRKIYLIGVDAGGLVALHAAALNSSIAGVAALSALPSWTDVLESTKPSPAVASFLPGVLRDYDIPDLAHSIAPRPAFVADSRDGRDILKGLKLL